MVLNEGSLHNNPGCVHWVIHRYAKCRKLQCSILVFKTLNDLVLYLVHLPECWWTTPPPHHHIMTCGTTAIGSKTTAGSSSCTSQEAWLVAHASLQDYHHSWYIFSCPPPPPHPTPSYAASYHLVRKCVIDLSRGSLWGEALQYYEDRKSLSLVLLQVHKHTPTHTQRTTLKTLCKKMFMELSR